MFEHEWDLESVDFPLNPDSVVLEIGGYVGRWARAMCERHRCYVYVYEPQVWAAERCRKELADFPKAAVYNMALGVNSGTFPMYNFETDGCTFRLNDHIATKPRGVGTMVEIGDGLKFVASQHIDVCLMNIEGYEFTLIPHMLRSGIMDRIQYFMCQFHTADIDDELAYIAICEELGKWGNVHFMYNKVLTCWEKKP